MAGFSELFLLVTMVTVFWSSVCHAAPIPEGQLPNMSRLMLLRAKLEHLERMLELVNRKGPLKGEGVVTDSEITTPAPSTAPPLPSEDKFLDALVANLSPQDITVLRHIKERLEEEIGPAGPAGLVPAPQIRSSPEAGQEKASYGNIVADDTPDDGLPQGFLEHPLPDDELGINQAAAVADSAENTEGASDQNGMSNNRLLNVVEDRFMSDVAFAKNHGLELKDLIEDLEKKNGIPHVEMSKEEEELSSLKKD